jgi:hypothetical protein
MSSSQISNWEKTLLSKTFPNDNKQYYYQHLPKLSTNKDLLKLLEMACWGRLSKMLWTMYHRPSETITGPIQDKMEMDSLAAFYNNSSRATKMKIQTQNKRKHSH